MVDSISCYLQLKKKDKPNKYLFLTVFIPTGLEAIDTTDKQQTKSITPMLVLVGDITFTS